MMNKQLARKRRGLKAKARIQLSDRSRLVVNRSSSNIYCQIVEMTEKGDVVLAAASTLDNELKSSLADKNKVEQANMVGKLLGKRALEKGVSTVAFDRAGYKFHGRVKALAEGAREAGLKF